MKLPTSTLITAGLFSTRTAVSQEAFKENVITENSHEPFCVKDENWNKKIPIKNVRSNAAAILKYRSFYQMIKNNNRFEGPISEVEFNNDLLQLTEYLIEHQHKYNPSEDVSGEGVSCGRLFNTLVAAQADVTRINNYRYEQQKQEQQQRTDNLRKAYAIGTIGYSISAYFLYKAIKLLPAFKDAILDFIQMQQEANANANFATNLQIHTAPPMPYEKEILSKMISTIVAAGRPEDSDSDSEIDENDPSLKYSETEWKEVAQKIINRIHASTDIYSPQEKSELTDILNAIKDDPANSNNLRIEKSGSILSLVNLLHSRYKALPATQV